MYGTRCLLIVAIRCKNNYNGHMVQSPSVNDAIRTAIRIELAKRRMNQSQLAEHVGVSKQHMSKLMGGKVGNVSEVWQRIFDELGLELTVTSKAEQ